MPTVYAPARATAPGGRNLNRFTTPRQIALACLIRGSAAMGTPFLGVPVVDSGGAYLYFFKAVDTTRVTLNSRYFSNGCFALGIRGAFPTDAAPVSDVVPAFT